MARRTLLFFICVALLMQFTEDELRAADGMDFLRWRMTEQARTSDGGMVVSFDLSIPPGANPEDIEVTYRALPQGNIGAETGGSAPETYRKKLGDTRPEGDGTVADVTVYSGRSELIELTAASRAGDARQYALTVFSCFGESGNEDPDAERTNYYPNRPAFRVATGQYYFRAQTGMPIEFSLDSGPDSVSVFEKGIFTSTAERDASGNYVYVPPHDDELSEAGYTAKKDVVFAASMPDGDLISFYVPVYRSFYGKIDLKGGLAVLSGSMLVSAALAMRAGRRFPWR
ncbi:MAG: hypothetical protein LBS75_08135 [Synergistaceae bacterium]|jgi:hypothetical protein|nr:hypothetical protein [Synergistaceae bacterium]